MAHEAVEDPGEDLVPRTFEDLAAGPERTESAAAANPVRADGPSGRSFVLIDADEFERLRLLEPKALRAADLTDDEVAYMLAQPIPPELARFDDEVPGGGRRRRGGRSARRLVARARGRSARRARAQGLRAA